MIRSLHIKNFQSHKDTELDFDPGVNIIIGPSDSGKSAILRALRWLFWNRPQGDGFRSSWCKKDDPTVVRVNICDGKYDHASRELFNGKNYYTLHAQRFDAIRSEVPKELQEYFNITDINLQRQLDAPFLLSNTAGEVAQHFNRVAKLDKIDSALSKINSWIREILNEIKYNDQQVKALSDKLKEFDHLEEFEIEVEALEEAEKRYTQTYQNKSKLESLLSDIRMRTSEIEEYSDTLKMEGDVDTLLSLYEKQVEKIKQQRELQADIDDLVNIEAEINNANQLTILEKPVNDLLESYDLLDQREFNHEKLSRLCIQIINIVKDIEKQNDKYNILHKRFEDEFPDVCPLCNKPK